MTIRNKNINGILPGKYKVMKTIKFQKAIFTSLFLLATSLAFSQIDINGKVVSENGEALPGVNVFINGTYDGASTDENGIFNFTTSENDTVLLKASFIGYKSWQKKLVLSANIEIEIQLKESVNTLDAVTITAGSFEAADESRASGTS